MRTNTVTEHYPILEIVDQLRFLRKTVSKLQAISPISPAGILMDDPAPKTVTQLLMQWRAGDEQALNQLLPLVYDELRRLAGRYMQSERPDHALQPTALVHEAYLGTKSSIRGSRLVLQVSGFVSFFLQLFPEACRSKRRIKMKRFTHFVFGAVIICSLIGGALGQGVVESDLQKIANRFIPAGMVTAHQAVRGKFAESASKDASGNIVVLYKKGSYGGRYEGLVLLPQGSDAYDQHKLPEPEAVWSMMDPIGVFFANADGDTENELFIIDKCYTGIGPTGARPFYRTRVYDWNGIAFSHVDSVSEKIGNANTVATAKARLRQFSRTLKSQKTQMLVAVEFGTHNEQIDKAAAAGEAWVKDPAQIIARTFGGFSEMRSKTIQFKAPTADEADSLSVTITNDGYLDDSVRGEKYSLELRMNEQGVWKFVTASKAWRCWPGRGNQDYSRVKCT